jgi:hypothetical protein
VAAPKLAIVVAFHPLLVPPHRGVFGDWKALPMSGETMTESEIEALSNEVRRLLQQRTCCPHHAGDVLLCVMASFALDDAGDDIERAARTVQRSAKNLSKHIRKGAFKLLRAQ